MKSLHRKLLAALCILGAVSGADVARAERIKDIASVAGVRANQLVGYGVVSASTAAATRPRKPPLRCRA